MPRKESRREKGDEINAHHANRTRTTTNQQTLYTTIDSPIGELLLVGDGETLSGLYMQDGRKPKRIAPDWSESAAPFADVKRSWRSTSPASARASTSKLAPEGAPFELEVWRALEAIPYGETVSYGEIARRVGQPSAARAVGTANGRNPIAVIVPCHRVIGADGSLTGYGGGLERKRLLLELERGQGRL